MLAKKIQNKIFKKHSKSQTSLELKGEQWYLRMCLNLVYLFIFGVNISCNPHQEYIISSAYDDGEAFVDNQDQNLFIEESNFSEEEHSNLEITEYKVHLFDHNNKALENPYLSWKILGAQHCYINSQRIENDSNTYTLDVSLLEGRVTFSLICGNENGQKTVKKIEGYFGDIYQGNMYLLGKSTFIYGSLIIYRSQLKSFTQTLGIQNITEDLIIKSNESLQHLKGLSRLKEVGGDVYITANPILVDFEGLDKLEIIGKQLFIDGNSSLQNFNGLHQLIECQNLSVFYSASLQSFQGLSSLTIIHDELFIWQNSQLTDLKGFENLRIVGEKIQIRENNNLTSVGMPQIHTLKNGILYITDNPELYCQDAKLFAASIGLSSETIFINKNKDCSQ